MSVRWPNWMKGSLKPDETIGGHKMLRWFLLPPTRRFAIYLHKHQADDPREPHDHPADNISIRLWGDLTEHVPVTGPGDTLLIRGAYPVMHGREVWFLGQHAITHAVKLPRFRRRRAEDVHRLETTGKPAYTIWIRFRARRTWGYYESSGWRPAVTRNQPPEYEETLA